MANNTDLILPEHISERIRSMHCNSPEFEALPFSGKGKLVEMVESLERKLIENALIKHKGNKTKAALDLGLSRLGLRKKMIRYGMEDKNSIHYKQQKKNPPTQEILKSIQNI